MKKVTAVLLGAGARGTIYARYALEKPEEFEIVAVAEPDAERRRAFARTFGVPEEKQFGDCMELLAQGTLADAALICTMDQMHTAPALKALELGYHVLLEKPMAPTEEECRAIARAAQQSGKVLSVCHVLRYSPFYSAIKTYVDSKELGEILAATQTENVGYWHQAHSFVRGNWGNTKSSTPMILQKCCHDTDILSWLIGGTCVRVSSYGALTHFTAKNAPEGAPARCLDGCPYQNTCIYYAPKFYLEHPTALSDGFSQMLCTDPTEENVLEALRAGPYGRCVYRCENDAVDHQNVSMVFENGAVASLMMCAFTEECNRTLHLMGTQGELWGDMEKNEIWVQRLGHTGKEKIPVEQPQTRYAYNHNGGDYCLIRDFVRAVREDDPESSRSSAQQSLQSHLICFAAEKSRIHLSGSEL